jgi:uncharacterized protein GlcG (DUF336 family)
MMRFAMLGFAAFSAVLPLAPSIAAPEVTSAPSIANRSAQQAIAAVAQCAVGKKITLSIVVLDRDGDVVAASRMDGAAPVYSRIATRKAKTSLLLGAPTVAFEGNEGIKLTVGVMDDFIFIPGAYPLFANGSLVGAIGASGAMPVDDDACAKAGQDAVGGASPAK